MLHRRASQWPRRWERTIGHQCLQEGRSGEDGPSRDHRAERCQAAECRQDGHHGNWPHLQRSVHPPSKVATSQKQRVPGHSATCSTETRKHPDGPGVKQTHCYIRTVRTTEPGSFKGRATHLHVAVQTQLRTHARQLSGHEPPQTRPLKQRNLISLQFWRPEGQVKVPAGWFRGASPWLAD